MAATDWKTADIEDLRTRCLSGDREALEELARRASPVLVDYAAFLLRSLGFSDAEEAGEDVAQTVLSRLAEPIGLNAEGTPIYGLSGYQPGRHRSPIEYLRLKVWTEVMNMGRRRGRQEKCLQGIPLPRVEAGMSEAQLISHGLELLEGMPPALVAVGRNILVGTEPLTGISPAAYRRRVSDLREKLEDSLGLS
jgi:hypothetical protein